MKRKRVIEAMEQCAQGWQDRAVLAGRLVIEAAKAEPTMVSATTVIERMIESSIWHEAADELTMLVEKARGER
jgi:hypothetical protein